MSKHKTRKKNICMKLIHFFYHFFNKNISSILTKKVLNTALFEFFRIFILIIATQIIFIYFDTISLRTNLNKIQNIPLSLLVGFLKGISVAFSEIIILFLIYSTFKKDGLTFFYDPIVNLSIAAYYKDYRMTIFITIVHIIVGLVCGSILRFLFFVDFFDSDILDNKKMKIQFNTTNEDVSKKIQLPNFPTESLETYSFSLMNIALTILRLSIFMWYQNIDLKTTHRNLLFIFSLASADFISLTLFSGQIIFFSQAISTFVLTGKPQAFFVSLASDLIVFIIFVFIRKLNDSFEFDIFFRIPSSNQFVLDDDYDDDDHNHNVAITRIPPSNFHPKKNNNQTTLEMKDNAPEYQKTGQFSIIIDNNFWNN